MSDEDDILRGDESFDTDYINQEEFVKNYFPDEKPWESDEAAIADDFIAWENIPDEKLKSDLLLSEITKAKSNGYLHTRAEERAKNYLKSIEIPLTEWKKLLTL